jgi:hypothetical protein
MSFTIYQNNKTNIEIIARPKIGSSTLQNPGIVYSSIYGEDYPKSPVKFKLKEDWLRYDGSTTNPNNLNVSPYGARFDDLGWIKYLNSNNTKYFFYRDPIEKYASGLTQIYFYGKTFNTPTLIVPEGIDAKNFKIHTVSPFIYHPDKLLVESPKVATQEIIKQLVHYYENAPDSFFETYATNITKMYSNPQLYDDMTAYTDPHVVRGLLHAVMLKILFPNKTQLVLLDNLDNVIRKHIISDDSFDIKRINVTNEGDAHIIKDPLENDLNKIKRIMHKQFTKIIRKNLADPDGPNDTKGFLDLEIKIWNKLTNNSEPLSILKMVVTELESNNLPILEKNYYEYLIECFRKQYRIV